MHHRFGFNDIPVLAALIALSIPPILTNTWVGIYHADRPLCDAAIALGMTPGKACGRCGSRWRRR